MSDGRAVGLIRLPAPCLSYRSPEVNRIKTKLLDLPDLPAYCSDDLPEYLRDARSPAPAPPPASTMPSPTSVKVAGSGTACGEQHFQQLVSCGSRVHAVPEQV